MKKLFLTFVIFMFLPTATSAAELKDPMFYGLYDTYGTSLLGVETSVGDAVHYDGKQSLIWDNDISTRWVINRYQEKAITLNLYPSQYLASRVFNQVGFSYDVNGSDVTVEFFNTENPKNTTIEYTKPIRTLKINGITAHHFEDFNNSTIKLIRIKVPKATTFSLREIDLYQDGMYLPVQNIKHVSTMDSITYNFTQATNAQIYLDDQLTSDGTYTKDKLKADTEYTVNFKIVYPNGKIATSTYKAKTLPDSTPPGDVKNLKAVEKSDNTVALSYVIPNDADFDAVEIYRDDVLLTTTVATSYVDNTAELGKTYVYKVVAVDTNGNKSVGVKTEVKMSKPPEIAEVQSLKISKVAPYSVSLIWQNPKKLKVDKVTIYRQDASLLRSFFGADYVKMQDVTDSVEFTDTSVVPLKKYTYKVVVTSGEFTSDGVVINAVTPGVSIDNATITKQDNGDFLVKWDAPVDGKISLVDGNKEYTVNASDKQILLSKDSINTNLVTGAPTIKLTPLDNNNLVVGNTITLGGLSVIGGGEGIFDAPDLVKAAASLLALVGGFILLGLAFRVVPMLVKTIRNAVISGGAKR